MDPRCLLQLARRRLGLIHSIHYAPDIPAKKEQTARSAHGGALEAEEPVLVMFDATVFGSGKDGFIMTPNRLCWRQPFQKPRQISWQEMDSCSITTRGKKVCIGNEELPLVPMSSSEVGAVAELLRDIMRLGGKHSPFRVAALPASPGPVAVLDAERIVELAANIFDGLSTLYVYPNIPPKKLANARAVHKARLDQDETVLVLHDNTLLGGARDGYLVTRFQFLWKNVLERPRFVEWRHLTADAILVNEDDLEIAGGAVLVLGLYNLPQRTAELLRAIVSGTRGETG